MLVAHAAARARTACLDSGGGRVGYGIGVHAKNVWAHPRSVQGPSEE